MKHLEPIDDLLANLGTQSKRFKERAVAAQAYIKKPQDKVTSQRGPT